MASVGKKARITILPLDSFPSFLGLDFFFSVFLPYPFLYPYGYSTRIPSSPPACFLAPSSFLPQCASPHVHHHHREAPSPPPPPPPLFLPVSFPHLSAGLGLVKLDGVRQCCIIAYGGYSGTPFLVGTPSELTTRNHVYILRNSKPPRQGGLRMNKIICISPRLGAMETRRKKRQRDRGRRILPEQKRSVSFSSSFSALRLVNFHIGAYLYLPFRTRRFHSGKKGERGGQEVERKGLISHPPS
ncbi:uncharacterized protein BDZ83DRAFT_251961 [Colletotrichum acutatum]|uniref:Uncharacterized protein n=1 Tax=Glomerella acutata TaxID=27357 RepID=A0AAD8UNN7_GLOAC|nr:uncharacterized protein BDZ83DRAFT_251961 [Colletotrichum acutatum]KAK1726723.1 hypothetical protein BDZ83DRAFT_251961 [Colletotrichum acutatum]